MSDTLVAAPEVEDISTPTLVEPDGFAELHNEQVIRNPEPTPEPVEFEPDIVDILEPKEEHNHVTLTFGGHTTTYIQKPLTFFTRAEFFRVLGENIDKAMAGEDGLTVNALFGAGPTSLSDFSASDFGDLDSFMGLVAKVSAYAEDFLKDCYVVWLGVPRGEREWAKAALDNLGDDEAINIIETFIDQNWLAIERFFTEAVPALAQRVQSRRKKS